MITLSSIPSVQQYKDALQSVADEIIPMQKQILKELLCAPNRTLTAKELAHLLGYTHCAPINGHYGRLGHLLSDALNFRPGRRANGSYRWWMILSTGEDRGLQGFHWTLHPELAQALQELGWGCE